MEITSGTLEEDQERCLEVDNTLTKDHISELPADILSSILSLLTTRDAVKARVLSPRWRFLYTAPSNLHFDLLSIFGITYDRTDWVKNSNNLWEGKLKFVRAVDQWLELCTSPKIYSFKVRYCLGIESSNHIDRWVSFAVRKQTEELYLNFSFVPQSCELYSFPCHLLPQGKASQLKHLSLKSCMMKPSPDFANCFNSLTKLQLNNVPLDQSDFCDILLGCVNLEFLKLKNCSLPATFFIAGHLRLRELFLKHCGRANKIEISCINLSTLDFFGELNKLHLIDVASLKDVFVYPSMRDSIFNEPAEDLPQLKNLKQVLFVNKVRPIPANLTRFRHLIKLDLMVFLVSHFNLLSVAFILNVAPQLQKFHLALQRVVHYGKVTWEYTEQLYPQLKEVEISGFRQRCNSLGLAIYLLKNAVGL